MSKVDADAVGEALLAIARQPLTAAREVVAALEPTARDALIRLYFRLPTGPGGEGRAALAPAVSVPRPVGWSRREG